MTKHRHVGRILIPHRYFLRWLQFDGGKIHYIGTSEDFLNTIAIVIEHPNLPKVDEAQIIPIVNPAFYWEDIYRVEPPMKGWAKLLWIIRRVKKLWKK